MRGSSVPPLPHAPTADVAALDGGWSALRRASWSAGNAREGNSRTKRCRSWRPLRQRAEAVKAAANLGSRHREAVALTAEHAAARSPPDRPPYPPDARKICESNSPCRGRDPTSSSRSILRPVSRSTVGRHRKCDHHVPQGEGWTASVARRSTTGAAFQPFASESVSS